MNQQRSIDQLIVKNRVRRFEASLAFEREQLRITRTGTDEKNFSTNCCYASRLNHVKLPFLSSRGSHEQDVE